MKIVIVGGVAAGASAATKARRENAEAEIIIFEKGEYVSFANCGLPYYVGGDVPKLDDLLMVTPKLFRNRFRIDVRTGHEVLSIDPNGKTLIVRHDGVEEEESYDKLILATGCAPARPPIPGIDLKGVFTVATIGDVAAISEKLEEGVESAVVVGGGFIGVETAEALLKRGIKTTMVEMQPNILSNFDPEMTTPAERALKRSGMKLVLKKGLAAIQGTEKVEGVELNTGTKIAADVVILAMGMKPQTALAESIGIKMGESGAIAVDETMQTSIKDIYAAGDIAESVSFASGKAVRNPLAGSANKQGRVAGASAAGAELKYYGAQGTSIVRAGVITIARTGLGEQEAKDAGFDCFVSYTSTRNHTSFYPDAQYMIIKLIVEKGSGRVLGAQAVGREGTDKRMDVLATAVYGHMTVFDLENLDLAYAPPFSAARDPVLMAGMTAANVVRGISKLVTVAELRELQKQEDYVIVDVRRPDEFSCGGIRGAVNIPVDEMRERYTELDKSKKYILYCGEGYRAYVAARFLTHMGYDVANLSGGYRTYLMDV